MKVVHVEWLHFEWQPLGMTDLISAEAVPIQRWRFRPCYGYRHRTVSYPQAKRRPEFEANKYPICQGLEISSDFHLLQFQAMQIGTAPFFIQQGDDQLPGQMLCTINSICIDGDKPYPWINHPEPLAPAETEVVREAWGFTWIKRPEPLTPEEPLDYLMIGDTGCIYISIDEARNLHSGMSCY